MESKEGLDHAWESAGRFRAGKAMGWGRRREEQTQEGVSQGKWGCEETQGNKGKSFHWEKI